MYLKTMSAKEALETFGKQLFSKAFVYIPPTVSYACAFNRVKPFGYDITPLGRVSTKIYVTKIEDAYGDSLGDAEDSTLEVINPESSLRKYATRVVVEDFEWEPYHKELCT